MNSKLRQKILNELKFLLSEQAGTLSFGVFCMLLSLSQRRF